ncbi:MAG: non-canonical purine NTP diphosphatase [Prevotella sp.]
MKIVFATNNNHKLREIKTILNGCCEIVSLKDIGCNIDIPETGTTLQENALQKAFYVFEHYGLDCFADDTGLEVKSLNGEPGVHSARYADNTDHDSEANMQKLLKKLVNNNNREARFRTVIALIQKNHQTDKIHTKNQHLQFITTLFEGEVKGTIDWEKHGNEGFGYDPIFIPEGYEKSFAELGEDIKNKISHRALAVAELADYLKNTK